MNMVFVLIALSLVFLAVGIYIFFWAVRSRQFKELDVQAFSILQEDEFVRDNSAETEPELVEMDKQV